MDKGKPGDGDECKKPKTEPDPVEEDGGKKNHMGVARKGGQTRGCQAERCAVDLTEARAYHRRHRVCEIHAKALTVVVGGLPQRFCQQCSRFHELAEFDDTKRSCRRRLAGHNERRRKSSVDSNVAKPSGIKSPGNQVKEMACGQVDGRGRNQIIMQDNASFKHFKIK